MRLYLLAAVFVVLAGPVVTQSQGRLQRNPRGVAFLCPDHDIDDGHELDIIEQSTGTVIQTINIGDPPLNAAGEVVASVKVQPLKVGVYAFKVRAKVGAIQSEDSDAYVWERAPGRPTIVAQ